MARHFAVGSAREPPHAKGGLAAKDRTAADAGLAQRVVIAAREMRAVLAARGVGQPRVRELAAQRQRDPLADQGPARPPCDLESKLNPGLLLFSRHTQANPTGYLISC